MGRRLLQNSQSTLASILSKSMSNPAWTTKQIEQHIRAGRLLATIKDEIFEYAKKNPQCSEWELQSKVYLLYKKYNLITDSHPVIVAFNKNAAEPHYFPPGKGSAVLQVNTLILLDVWARVSEPGSPFADATWMAFYGHKPSVEISRAYQTVIASRDAAVNFLQTTLRKGSIPTGKEVDDAAFGYLIEKGYKENLKHHTGHSIGFTSPHGRWRHVNHKNNTALVPNLGYTIEPGVYFNDSFGIRSEIDFYITEERKLVVTTEVEKELKILE